MSNELTPPDIKEHRTRDLDLEAIRARQPYEMEFEGIRLRVDRDVFPPDLGYTTLLLARAIQRYAPRAALDMGCGTGLLSIVLRKRGVQNVWAVDIHEPAVACTRLNVARNGVPDIHIHESDLFAAVDPGVRFDLIVFNQPYYPCTRDPIFGLGADGGAAIVRRFLIEAERRLSPNGVLIMPFSDMAGPENSPRTIGEAMGFRCTVIDQQYDDTGIHQILELSP